MNDSTARHDQGVIDSGWTWKVHAVDETAVDAVHTAVNGRLSRLTCTLLAQRGLTSPDDIERFLEPSLTHLRSPWDLKDVDIVVDRLLAERDRGGRIFIHGDYDADGLSSTALYAKVLAAMGFDVVPFVPHRMVHGYGLSFDAIKAGVDNFGCSLVLTCDVGVSAHETVQRCKDELGIDVLVTDHHTPGGTLPDAAAVVDPHRADCGSVFRELCGAGVAFKVLQALLERHNTLAAQGTDGYEPLKARDVLHPYLYLAGIGTIADVVPLRDENRVFAWHGLRSLEATSDPGIRALCEIAGIIPERLDEQSVAFDIGPRLNAIGRIDDSSHGLALLLEEDPVAARALADLLDRANKERREIERQIFLSAQRMIEELPDGANKPGYFLWNKEWHPGIVGIVASRIVDMYGRPVFLFGPDGKGGWKGSGRAPEFPGLSLYRVLAACSEHLAGFGGHAGAAGASLKGVDEPQLLEARAAFEASARKALGGVVLNRTVDVSIVAGVEDLNERTLTELDLLAPYGEGNPPVTIGVDHAVIAKSSALGAPERGHVKLQIQSEADAECSFNNVVGWRLLQRLDGLMTAAGRSVRLVGSLRRNIFRGQAHLQFIVEDAKVGPVPELSRRTKGPGRSVRTP